MVVNVYRLALELSLPLFFEQSVEATGGIGWVFGMVAFFSLFAMILKIVLAWKGQGLRKISSPARNFKDRGRRGHCCLGTWNGTVEQQQSMSQSHEF